MSSERPPTGPSLPHLEAAQDPEFMRGLFQRYLLPTGEVDYQIRECRVRRVRRGRGRGRCILDYSLHLEDPDTGRETNQLVTGLIYAGDRTRQAWEELRASAPQRNIAGAFQTFLPLSYIPDLDMLVQIFPYDDQLPALPLLWMEPLPELEPLLLTRFGAGDWRTEAWTVEQARYVSQMRATLRLTLQAQDATSGRVEQRRFYAKIYADEGQGEQTFQAHQALWNRAGEASFAVGRPLVYLSSLRLLVQEEVPGTSLRKVILQEDRATPVARRIARVLKNVLLGEAEASPAVRLVARSLAALHLDHVPLLRRRLPREEIDKLKTAGRLLGQNFPHLRREIRKITRTAAAGLEGGPLVPAHCDLGLEHVLLDGDRVGLIDLDTFAQANPMLDVARILSRLTVLSVSSRLSRGQARTLARAFTKEYFSRAPNAWRAWLPSYYVGALLRAAVGLTRRPGPNEDEVRALVEEAKGSVEGRVW